MIKQIFISYRHESQEHARGVKRLAELLREAKFPVAFDQFYLNENPGGPDSGGWTKWCEDCASQSACVLIIASEGWFTAYNKEARPSIGLGAASEADIFRQELWDEAGRNTRIRLVFLNELSEDMVPIRLRAWHQFRLFESDENLDQLIRWAASCLGLENIIERPTIRWPDTMTFEPDLADRTGREWPAVVDLLSGRSRERILMFEGGTGLGKSALILQTIEYAKLLGIPTVRVDFKGGGLDVQAVLGQFELDLGAVHLPKFSRDGANKTHLLRKDLRSLRRPVLVIFDTYEDAAANKTVNDWLNLQLLTEVETALGVAVIIAGQKVPNLHDASWRDLARHLALHPITEAGHWEPWIMRRYPSLRDRGADLHTILLITHGNPMLVANACRAIVQS
jgi:hypothetical protein